jgi:hypothetical protein
MMGRRERGQGQFFYRFDLDKVVPTDRRSGTSVSWQGVSGVSAGQAIRALHSQGSSRVLQALPRHQARRFSIRDGAICVITPMR